MCHVSSINDLSNSHKRYPGESGQAKAGCQCLLALLPRKISRDQESMYAMACTVSQSKTPFVVPSFGVTDVAKRIGANWRTLADVEKKVLY